MIRDRRRRRTRGLLCLLVGLVTASVGSAAAGAGKDAARIDALIAALRAAPDELAARTLEGQLREVWQAQGSPAGGMLLNRAMREMQSNSPEPAIEDADAVLVLDPDYVEAFSVRAAAKLLAGNTSGAVRDAAEALKREPRHIGALMVLSRAAEQGGQFKAAYDAWLKLLELDPKTPDGRARSNDLKRSAVGEDI